MSMLKATIFSPFRRMNGNPTVRPFGADFLKQILFDAAVVIEELLRGSEWSAVKLFRTLHEPEVCAELAVKRFGIVTHAGMVSLAAGL